MLPKCDRRFRLIALTAPSLEPLSCGRLRRFISPELTEWVVLCTSHRLQPCDTGVFGPLKTAYREQMEQLYRGDANTVGTLYQNEENCTMAPWKVPFVVMSLGGCIRLTYHFAQIARKEKKKKASRSHQNLNFFLCVN